VERGRGRGVMGPKSLGTAHTANLPKNLAKSESIFPDKRLSLGPPCFLWASAVPKPCTLSFPGHHIDPWCFSVAKAQERTSSTTIQDVAGERFDREATTTRAVTKRTLRDADGGRPTKIWHGLPFLSTEASVSSPARSPD
jgi:hypothetical protein